ncbi:hypothetical protein [Escherichia phage M01]|nr:hypothetical protein [Escherichia phage M01]
MIKGPTMGPYFSSKFTIPADSASSTRANSPHKQS